MKNFVRNCLYCGEDMRVSNGQIAYFHAKCRIKGRHKYTKHTIRNVYK